MHRALVLVLLLPILVACRTHRYRQSGEQTMETTVYEGQPAEFLPPQPRPHERPSTAPATTAAVETEETQQPAIPRPSASPHPAVTSSAAPQFPVAKPVPGKPGFVYSPYDGAMIDVTGFSSGSKAKDPATNKIFIVP